MVYNCLKLSSEYQLDYCEIDKNNRTLAKGYDFYFFNYHPYTMNWLETRRLKKELGFVITMVLEVAPGEAFVMCPENDFNLYCILDPTYKPKKKNVASFPRPLEQINFSLPQHNNQIPVIGSFGFATKGKGFQHVVEAVNKEFKQAIVKINIPYGDFVPESESYAKYIGDLCSQIANTGIEVQVTHDFMSKDDLIKWCASNTLNCFMYDRQMPGLSATTDQAIVSSRPLSVSDNDTFRHITAYIPPYPEFSLKDSIEKSLPMVKKMEMDWQPQQFKHKFEKFLFSQLPSNNSSSEGELELSIIKNGFADKVYKLNRKIKRIFKKIKAGNLQNKKQKDEVI